MMNWMPQLVHNIDLFFKPQVGVVLVQLEGHVCPGVGRVARINW